MYMHIYLGLPPLPAPSPRGNHKGLSGEETSSGTTRGSVKVAIEMPDHLQFVFSHAQTVQDLLTPTSQPSQLAIHINTTMGSL